jgi:hypothetical protein
VRIRCPLEVGLRQALASAARSDRLERISIPAARALAEPPDARAVDTLTA